MSRDSKGGEMGASGKGELPFSFLLCLIIPFFALCTFVPYILPLNKYGKG
jgi:hypothetical protein